MQLGSVVNEVCVRRSGTAVKKKYSFLKIHYVKTKCYQVYPIDCTSANRSFSQ